MPSRSAARATASASMRSDLPRSRPARRASSHQLRRDPDDPLAAGHQNRSNEPDTCRQSSTPRPARRRATAPSPAARGNPSSPTWTVFSPRSSPVAAAIAATVCDPCACPPRTRSSARPPVSSTDSWTLGGHGLLEGAATLLSSHAEPSRTGDERHCERKSGPTGRQPETESQLAAGPGPSPARRTSPTRRIRTASLDAKSR